MEGILVYDAESSRYQVRYGLEHYSSGLHCGECLSVLGENGVWQDSRIEFSHEMGKWYLVGLHHQIMLDGLRVRYGR